MIGGVLLLLLALFMLAGFLNADVDRSAGTTLIALVLAVGLPAGAGIALIARRRGGGQRLAARRETLRRQTLESELVRLAGRHGGKLTSIEVVRELAVSPEDADAVLRDLVHRSIAEPEVTESGLLVYAFHDLQKLEEKPRSKGVLE
jgi:hypothetical protein